MLNKVLVSRNQLNNRYWEEEVTER